MQISDKDENYCPNLIFGAAVWTINRGKDLAEWKIGTTFVPGRMAEWSIAAVLKTVELRGSGGSNPSLSAINTEYQCIARSTPDFTPKNVRWGVLFSTSKISYNIN